MTADPPNLSGVASGGALPSAVESGGKLYVAYIGGGADGHTVWLTRADAGADLQDRGAACGRRLPRAGSRQGREP